jgi:ribose 5-phosphate isomerase B
MRIHVATDHAGLTLKNKLLNTLSSRGFDVIDHGAFAFDPNDDYPRFILPAAEAVAQDLANGVEALGVIFGGSGNGEQIAANKVNGVRAALVWNEETAKLARQHNDANIISIGARQHSELEVLHLIDVFVQEPFSNEERHKRRISQIAEYEQQQK